VLLRQKFLAKLGIVNGAHSEIGSQMGGVVSVVIVQNVPDDVIIAHTSCGHAL